MEQFPKAMSQMIHKKVGYNPLTQNKLPSESTRTLSSKLNTYSTDKLLIQKSVNDESLSKIHTLQGAKSNSLRGAYSACKRRELLHSKRESKLYEVGELKKGVVQIAPRTNNWLQLHSYEKFKCKNDLKLSDNKNGYRLKKPTDNTRLRRLLVGNGLSSNCNKKRNMARWELRSGNNINRRKEKYMRERLEGKQANLGLHCKIDYLDKISLFANSTSGY